MTKRDPLEFLKDLVSVAGLSGYEGPVARIIEQAWQPLVDEISYSKLGSLHALSRGNAAAPRHSLMVAVHMDAIGLIVTRIEEGFLRVSAIGGIDARILPGQLVDVHASGAGEIKEIKGVIVQPSTRLLPEGEGDGPVDIKYLLIDTGLPAQRVKKLVRVGDMVSFAQPPLELSGSVLAGRSMDNRASIAALTVCLEALSIRPHAWDVWAVASVKEETNLVGAQTSAYQLRPDIAVVIDVTWAKGPGANDWNTFPLGKGPTLAWGPNIHPALHLSFKKLAEEMEIPHAVEVLPRHSGTDAFATQVTAEGIPSMVIGIPLRYMHTPTEVVSIKDIQRVGRLLAEFISRLDTDFVNQITWDDD